MKLRLGSRRVDLLRGDLLLEVTLRLYLHIYIYITLLYDIYLHQKKESGSSVEVQEQGQRLDHLRQLGRLDASITCRRVEVGELPHRLRAPVAH